MKIEIRYKWRTPWAGKWSTTRYWATEEQIRAKYPDAVCLPDTRQELQVPESPEEVAEAWRRTDTGKVGSGGPGAPGG